MPLGTGATLNALRQSDWILAGRQLIVEAIILRTANRLTNQPVTKLYPGTSCSMRSYKQQNYQTMLLVILLWNHQPVPDYSKNLHR